MNSAKVIKELGRFKLVQSNTGSFYFYSRRLDHGHRMVKVIVQGDSCLTMPITQQDDGQEKVVFHAKTIKSLVDFLEGK
jgi:hypothetical protein